MGLGDSYKLNWYGYKVPVGKKGVKTNPIQS